MLCLFILSGLPLPEEAPATGKHAVYYFIIILKEIFGSYPNVLNTLQLYGPKSVSSILGNNDDDRQVRNYGFKKFPKKKMLQF